MPEEKPCAICGASSQKELEFLGVFICRRCLERICTAEPDSADYAGIMGKMRGFWRQAGLPVEERVNEV